MDKKAISILILEEMTRLQYTRADLCKESGLALNSIARILSGNKNYGINSLYAVMKVLSLKIRIL